MKIRNGFVSNSSSSSFCIYGVCVDVSDFEESEKFINYLKEDCDKNLEDFEDEDEYKDYLWADPLDALYCYLESIDLDAHFDDNGYIYVGTEWCDIRDDQTGAEFKKEVEAGNAVVVRWDYYMKQKHYML